MKRRKGWFIGLGIAALGACVFGWKWSERPPYRFMQGASLWAIEADPLPPDTGVYSATYALKSPPNEVSRAAVLELGLPRFEWGEGEMEFLVREPQPDVFIRPAVAVNIVTHPSAGPTPIGAKTLITVCYPKHTLISRLKSWLSGIGPRRGRP